MPEGLPRYRRLLYLAGLLVLLTGASLNVIAENEQAVVKRLGQPVRVINRFEANSAPDSGVVFTVPLLDSTVRLDRGLVSWVAPAQRIVTADQQTLLIDTQIIYRIVDPERLVGSLGTGGAVGKQLGVFLPALMGQSLSQRRTAELVGPDAGGAMGQLRAALQTRMQTYGVRVLDVRIVTADLAEGSLQQTYELMKGRHERQAEEIREQSARDAQEISSVGDARSAQILQASAGRDPEFYGYFRALRSYELTYGDPERTNTATIVIPPDSEYLKHFNGSR